jgi:hypothetical protein
MDRISGIYLLTVMQGEARGRKRIGEHSLRKYRSTPHTGTGVRSLESTRSHGATALKSIFALAGEVVDRSRCGAYTRTDESPFLGIACPGANSGPTPGAYRGTCHRTASCGHHCD